MPDRGPQGHIDIRICLGEYSILWYGMVWYGIVQYGIMQYAIVWYNTKVRILQSGSRAPNRGDSTNHCLCRILVSMWSFGPLT